MKNTDSTTELTETEPAGIVPRFGKQQWIPYVLPMLVFMLTAQLEPAAPTEDTTAQDGFIAYSWYPLVYTLRIGLTLAAIAVAWPMYRSFPLKVSPWAIGVGVVGVVLWVGICYLQLEKLIPETVSGWLGGGGRVAFNPYQQLGDRPAAMIGFLAVRFLGLALVVPLIEEFFLRGFVVRFLEGAKWWELPIGSGAAICWAAVIIYAVPTHPSEMFAAIVWFSLVTAMVVYTKNIWDAVVAHVITNLLLGVYVLVVGDWHLW